MLTGRVRQVSAPRQHAVICSGASVPYEADAICSIHFGGTNHELITADRALYNDGGSSKKRGMDCTKAGSVSAPTAKKNNFSAQVSID